MVDTPQGETEPSKNDATPAAAPAAQAATPAASPAVDTSEVERLRKELEQQKMRANQLENEKKAREEAEAAKRAAELEEQNQYKELYEQERLKREAIETETEKKEREAELRKAKQDILGKFGDDVKELAEEVGLDLVDNSEDAIATFQEKLEKLNSRVAKTASVGPNNPAPKSNNVEYSTEELREKLPDEKAFHDIVTRKFPGIASMTSQQ